MFDKVEYWLDLCDDNMISARILLNSKRNMDVGFYCHQITEKALKAMVASVTMEIPPKIHDLKKLASKGKISDILSEKQLEFLVELEPLNIEARYPDYKRSIAKMMTDEKTARIFKETEEFLCWIKQRLGK